MQTLCLLTCALFAAPLARTASLPVFGRAVAVAVFGHLFFGFVAFGQGSSVRMFICKTLKDLARSVWIF